VDRTQKEQTVTALKSVFDDAVLVVITHYSGLDVAQITDLRVRMADAGARFKVTKNRLTRRALEGTRFAALDGLFSGPTAIAYSEDPVAAAKVSVGFAKENDRLVIVGGALNDRLLGTDEIRALAALPSLDELRAQFVALLQTPAQRIASVLLAPGAQLARTMSAYARTGEAG
jgi:large subunit ribosomal protein L10